jgi:hypothetical protein
MLDIIWVRSYKPKEKLKSSSIDNNKEDKESNELGYDGYEDQLEEKQEGEETREITTNQIF